MVAERGIIVIEGSRAKPPFVEKEADRLGMLQHIIAAQGQIELAVEAIQATVEAVQATQQVKCEPLERAEEEARRGRRRGKGRKD